MSVSRIIPLPTDLKFDNAKADFENGMLTITVPKAEPIASKKKKIEITHK